MAYTPNLTMESSCTLRRIAWALGLPMTTTIQDIFSKLPQIIEKEAVCNGCRDKSRCEICEFNKTEKVNDPILTIEGKELVLIPPKQKKRKKSA